MEAQRDKLAREEKSVILDRSDRYLKDRNYSDVRFRLYPYTVRTKPYLTIYVSEVGIWKTSTTAAASKRRGGLNCQVFFSKTV